MPSVTLSDWRTIADEKEKYAAYLCSREWCAKREAVKIRSSGFCERCNYFRANHVHHLTYVRKYNEQLDDLQAICRDCHGFIHGKAECDPVVELSAFRAQEAVTKTSLTAIGDDDWDGLGVILNSLRTINAAKTSRMVFVFGHDIWDKDG